MASLNMVGPYLLTEHEINANVEFGRIGNYAFGYLNDKGVFIVRYVGRSDTNLHTKIMLGLIDNKKNPAKYRYEWFKFSYAPEFRFSPKITAGSTNYSIFILFSILSI